MPLAQGTKIGACHVTGHLGTGGMGEVYRARDTTLDRDVALKVLPDAFTADPDRRARFEREAKVLASLNHPNIAQIHGIEDAGGSRALVLELVEGPTVADLVARGPVTLDDAVRIARQIASALQAAHGAGVVHRDLKPANVKVRDDGTVKVLDFGLAKALDPETEPAPGTDRSQPPTLTTSATRLGVIMGTPSYMSPEQASGAAVDVGADLWSFGVLLYEILVGERLFEGETAPHVLARVLDRDIDLSKLPAATPGPLRRVLRRCLERDPRRRMRDAGEAISDLEQALETASGPSGGEAAAPPRPRRPSVAVALAGLALGAAAAAAAFWAFAPAPDAPAVRRLALTLPTVTAGPDPFALAPDGSFLVYTGRTGRTRQLMVRRMDQLDPQPLAGTEGAVQPFLSPDGEWVGFFSAPGSTGPTGPSERLQPRWTLKKAPLRGGPAVTLASGTAALGASWGDDDRIVIGGVDGLRRLPATGGTPELVGGGDAAAETMPGTPGAAPGSVDAPTPPGDSAGLGIPAMHSAPHVLPGARAALVSLIAPADAPQLHVVRLDTGERQFIATGTSGTYTPTGHLVFWQSSQVGPGATGTLMAAPFDLDRAEMTAAPVPLAANVGTFALAADGTLVYSRRDADREAESRTLVWVNRDGAEEPLPAPPGGYEAPRFSPDGERVALTVSSEPERVDIAIYDLVRQVSNRLTFEAEVNVGPVWTPDGERVVFTAAGEGRRPGLFWKAADGTGQAERLTDSDAIQVAEAWARGADALIVSTFGAGLQADLQLLSLEGDRAPTPLIADPFSVSFPALSPDERWIAYQSNESGRFEVYVRPFPNVADGKWQVSQGGGLSPVWSPAGGELFFRRADQRAAAMMAVAYTADPTFTPSRPEPLFEAPYRMAAFDRFRPWDVAPDGQRFLMLKEQEAAPGRGPGGPARAALVVVTDWFAELVAQVPVR